QVPDRLRLFQHPEQSRLQQPESGSDQPPRLRRCHLAVDSCESLSGQPLDSGFGENRFLERSFRMLWAVERNCPRRYRCVYTGPSMHRRTFLRVPLAAAPLALAAAAEPADDRVHAIGDGVPQTPQDYARLLVRLTQNDAVTADSYSLGGIVERLETRMAALLGKE